MDIETLTQPKYLIIESLSEYKNSAQSFSSHECELIDIIRLANILGHKLIFIRNVTDDENGLITRDVIMDVSSSLSS